jgi:NAD(P)-dependent dehydrogenase (short-subunit alcohol dehydrogenase family)
MICNRQILWPFGLYGTSSSAHPVSRELARRLSDHNVTVNSVSPGFVATRFGMQAGGVPGFGMRFARFFARSAEVGAETLVYLASSPDVAAVSGEFFYQGRRGRLSLEAQDDAVARRLWHESERIAIGSTSRIPT